MESFQKVRNGDILPLGDSGRYVKILEYVNNTSVLIEFQDTGFITRTHLNQIRRGTVKDPLSPTVYGVGMIGVGEGKATEGGKSTKEHRTWLEMLRRVYSKEQRIKRPTYEGVSVDKEWLNFQKFYDWSKGKVWGEGFHLDKDLILPKNRVYYEGGCTLIPPELNSFISLDKRGGKSLPLGVNFKKEIDKFVTQISRGGRKMHLGSYPCPDEAFKVYREAKNEHARELADKWEGKVDERAIQALRKFDIVEYI